MSAPPEADALTTSRGAAPSAVLIDKGSLGRAYEAKTARTPHLFIIDETGTLVYRGGIDDKPTTDPADIAGANNYVRQAMAELASGKPIANPVTRPYGCSVKF